ncbi:MAG: DUF1592 domain-containing protein [Myxococcales bacterium]|nr:MAG: DUF1592 domain-containing protein [Myxococcales bacterium]
MLAMSVLAGCTARIDSGAAADVGGTGGLTQGPPRGDSNSTPEGEIPLDCSKPGVGAAPLRRLTRGQYDNSIRDLLGIDGLPSLALSADEKLAAFASNAVSPVSRLTVEQYRDVAEDLAARATRDGASRLTGCEEAMQDAACADRFIASFGRRALRRPLEVAEQERYRGLFSLGAARGFGDGIRLVVTAVLQSPSFLYHLEVAPAPAGTDVTALDGYELASRLAFTLWSSAPDEDLLSAAAAGELAGAEGIRKQAERLLLSDRARGAIASFHLQWLGLDNLLDLEKDASLFPEYDAALATAMRDETVGFADFVLRRGDGKLETLLSAPFTVAGGALLTLYGAAGAPRADGTVLLDPLQRAGLLTQASFLAGHSHAGQTSPVQRGLAVRKNLLCTELPDPPMNVNATPPAPDPKATTRQRFEQHRADPSCVGCHQLLDPIGVGFESYDAIGRYRSSENGLPIDASGQLVGAGDASGDFSSAVELAQRLSTSADVRACLQKQWFRFSLGRFEAAADACSLQQLASAFETSGHDVRALLLALVTSDSFRYRKVQP